MPKVTVTHSNRNLTLDVLRGVAVLLIIAHHLTLPTYLKVQTQSDKLFTYFVKLLIPFTRGGWIAVDMFFVLSGFLVSGLLFNEHKKKGQIGIKNFLIRRSFKIYPPFIFFILLTFVGELIYSSYTDTANFPAGLYVKDLFFVHNYLGGRWDQTWSLDVEEFFYLTVPFFLSFLIKAKHLNFRYLSGSYLFLLCFGICTRWLVVIHSTHFNFAEQYTKTHFRLDGIFLGLLMSYVYNFEPDRLNFIIKRKLLLGTLAAIFLLSQFVLDREKALWEAVVMPALNPWAFSVLIVLALDAYKAKDNFLAYVGRQSYSIYLWHYVFVHYLGISFILKISMSLHNLSDTAYNLPFKVIYLIYVPTYLALSVVTGIVFTKIIETPVLKLRDKLFPSRVNAIITTNKKQEVIEPLVKPV